MTARQEAALRCLTCGATIFDPLAGACGECGAQDSYVGTQWLKVPPEMRPLDTPPDQPRSQEAALRDIVTRALRAAFSFTNPAAVDGLVEATLAELRAALAATPPEHVHTPTSKPGDTNAYCSTCGFFPLPQPEENA